MGIVEKIEEIKHEMNRTQKNKATEYHIGLLKARLAKLQSQLIAETSGGGAGGAAGFEVAKQGCSRVALVGFPSVGKSTFLSTLTTTSSEVASYEFTTLTCVPGFWEIHGAQVQILDLPGIIEGASNGIGRGKQVISTARTADCILMMLDACKADTEREVLTRELEYMGIRLNKTRPDITVTKIDRGGIKFTATGPLTHLDYHSIKTVLIEYKIHNADVVIRCDPTVDDLIDVLEGQRVYIPCIYVINKIDMVSLPAVEHYAQQPHTVVISIHDRLNLEYLQQVLWEHLRLVRIYTRSRGSPPNLDPKEAIFLSGGATVADICLQIHKDMLEKFNYAIVWGRSVQHCPQRVGKDHALADEDVMQIVLKK